MPGELFAEREGAGGGQRSRIIAEAFVASVLSLYGVLLLTPPTWPEVPVNALLSSSKEGGCVCDGPLHSALPSQGLFRNCRRSRRWGEIRLGGVTRHRKGECCFFFFLSLSLLLSFSLPRCPPPPSSVAVFLRCDGQLLERK